MNIRGWTPVCRKGRSAVLNLPSFALFDIAQDTSSSLFIREGEPVYRVLLQYFGKGYGQEASFDFGSKDLTFRFSEEIKLPNHLSLWGFVLVIMAAETTGEIEIPNIIRILFPGNFHGGKKIGPIDLLDRLKR